MIGTLLKALEGHYSDPRIKLLVGHSIIWWFTKDGLLAVLDQWTHQGQAFESEMLCPKTVQATKEWLGY